MGQKLLLKLLSFIRLHINFEMVKVGVFRAHGRSTYRFLNETAGAFLTRSEEYLMVLGDKLSDLVSVCSHTA